MSAMLIFDTSGPHGFIDDLESSIYVLLWTALMYSEDVSISDPVMPFLKSVLDPKCYNRSGGTAKEDFLKARSFLNRVKFPNRPALHKLICDLADLFRYRYLPAPDKAQREIANRLQLMSNDDSSLGDILKGHHCTLYDHATHQLRDHAATIELFETALLNPEWPIEDTPVRQEFEPNPSAEPYCKTGWSMVAQ